ncbi:MAG: hypothetical protein GY714_14995 [Desulfobacterales bacterium]|nr:hypothetical protein [Desulfobacterales bacterium]
MKKILILYHSGSGSTRLIGEIFGKKLLKEHHVDISEISKGFSYGIIDDYDFVIIGFPTYHCEPSNVVVEFVEKMPFFENPKKIFVYTTCGIYGGNGIRNLIKLLLKKNLVTTDYEVIVGPASDVSLMFSTSLSKFLSKITYVLRYQVTALWKINTKVSIINKKIKSSKIKLKLPFYKWYVPLNDIAKYFGEKKYDKYKDNIHLIEGRCTNCNICISGCVSNCWHNGNAYPEYKSDNCEFCLKCIHHCPDKAIAFSDGMKDKMRLNRKFYKRLEKKYFSK